MHSFLRAIGFSNLKNRKELKELLTDVVKNANERAYTTDQEDVLIGMFSKDFANNAGISVCGVFDEEDNFSYEYFFPYLRGSGISSEEDVSVERHASQESYAGVCDDIRLGVSMIFYLQNMIPYIKAQVGNILPIKGTTLTLSALSNKGSIMMPLIKNENQKAKTKKASNNRNQLIAAAREGDEDAIESLTLEDMDTYTVISKKIHTEDVFSLVDTYFMPYGVECDQYSILGEIEDFCYFHNKVTGEKLCQLLISCNDVQFDVCINSMDLLGQPEVGRRFKGVVWMQGFINFPDQTA